MLRIKRKKPVELTPKQRKIKPKNYASNFDTNRKEPWTH